MQSSSGEGRRWENREKKSTDLQQVDCSDFTKLQPKTRRCGFHLSALRRKDGPSGKQLLA